MIMEKTPETVDRNPSVAGKFYPADKNELHQELKMLFDSASPQQPLFVRAIICPHAGYIFSGKIMASAFNQIDENRRYKRVFIIGSSHHKYFNKAAVYCDGDFIMPYGKEKVDTQFGKMLVEKYPELFTDDRSPHLNEHSIEVLLPLLHYKLKSAYVIIPILLGTSKSLVCKEIASILNPYFTDENLFIISSDFSHYPKYEDAKRVDALTKNAICANNPDILLTQLTENDRNFIPNLATSLCGWTSVLTLLYITSASNSFEFHAIDYCNSGDIKLYCDHEKVVGYWAIDVVKKNKQAESFQLSDTDKMELLTISRKTLVEYLRSGKILNINEDHLSDNLKINCGAFVTLHNDEKLRGCIGCMTGDLPLFKMVQEMSISAATRDHRFVPITSSEFSSIDIEISVLSPLKKMNDISEIELGLHGILIEKDYHRGVFLPQVGTETGWNKEQFLGHCSSDKAGLGWNGWKSANIYIFTATIFSEKENM